MNFDNFTFKSKDSSSKQIAQQFFPLSFSCTLGDVLMSAGTRWQQEGGILIVIDYRLVIVTHGDVEAEIRASSVGKYRHWLIPTLINVLFFQGQRWSGSSWLHRIFHNFPQYSRFLTKIEGNCLIVQLMDRIFFKTSFFIIFDDFSK